MRGNKIFTVDKFLGLNESADGETELKPGEASKIENFYLTDNYNLKTRPGVVKVVRTGESQEIVYAATGNAENGQWLILVKKSETGAMSVSTRLFGMNTVPVITYIFDADTIAYPVKVFSFGDSVYAVTGRKNKTIAAVRVTVEKNGIRQDQIFESDFYAPLMLSGAAPDGGGTSLEKANLLTNRFRLQFSADGTAKEFKLPDYTATVEQVTVDSYTTGTFDSEKHTYVFETAPGKGINNIEFLCTMEEDDDILDARDKFLHMKHAEAYNGATDTRLFFYGDGTNVCLYSGIAAIGSGLYVPLGNEIAADASASPITAMIRNYSSLIGFQPDSAFVISYDPITLDDGTVTAGFYMRTASREFGNEMNNQVQTVNNYLRTFCNGSLYEWKYTASQYRDERYAKCISQKVSRILSKADPANIVTCDDNTTHTYYMFLNDEEGTVLVNRYDLDLWTAYKGKVFCGTRFAAVYDGKVIFCNKTVVYRFDPDAQYDQLQEGDQEKNVPIQAVWESGFMDFGAPNKLKFSSKLWVSMFPESGSEMEVTVKTDKRGEYMVKTAGYNFLDFSRMDFSNFSFLTYAAPKVRRIMLKVKKFVYYKLIFRVTKPGARATVLGYEQQVRYSSDVK